MAIKPHVKAQRYKSAETYELPKATATVLGGVKVGSGLSVTDGGVLSATGSLPAYVAGDANKKLSVNSAGTGVEWQELTGELPAYTSADAEKKLAVNSAGTGLEWVSGGGTPTLYHHHISLNYTVNNIFLRVDYFNFESTAYTKSTFFNLMSGVRHIAPSGACYVSDASKIVYDLYVSGGMIYVSYYDNGSAASLHFDINSNNCSFSDTVKTA